MIIDPSIDIDALEYSRLTSMLPAPCRWGANANRKVAEQLGHQRTQSVMYSVIGRLQRYSGLAADDVNMIEFGMTGHDWLAPSPDDYTIDLEYVADCSQANIEVAKFPFGAQGPTGSCPVEVDLSYPHTFPTGPRHYNVVKDNSLGEPRITLNFNQDLLWDFIFNNGFESGNTSAWSSTVP